MPRAVESPLNVVVCLCDQLRAFDVGAWGFTAGRTPHIDRLAAEGVRFELAVSNNPVCTPSRCSLLSGQYSRTCTGATNNTNEPWPSAVRDRLLDPLLPERFRDAGYDTALIGKWHVWVEPLLCGFDHAVYPHIVHRHFGQQYVVDRGQPFTVDEFAPDYETRYLDDWLSRRGDRPFFLFHNISQPHMPLGPGNVPPRLERAFDPAQVPIRANAFVNGQLVHDRAWFITYTDPDYWYRMYQGEKPRPTDTVPDDFDLRDLTAHYMALTTCCDEQVGALMASLHRHGLNDNTLVVFLSDHGDNLGSHGLFNKGQLIDESIRIPMLFHAPGRLAPWVETRAIGQVIDVAPTVLDLAGLPPSPTMQGDSLVPVLGPAPDDPRAEELRDRPVFIETNSAQVGIRTRSYTYGAKLDPDTGELVDDRYRFHDNAADPLQTRNLAHTGEEQAVADRLRDRLLAWHASVPWQTPAPRSAST